MPYIVKVESENKTEPMTETRIAYCDTWEQAQGYIQCYWENIDTCILLAIEDDNSDW